MTTEVTPELARLYLDHGLDEVCNSRTAKVHGHWVLVRGLTESELEALVGGIRSEIAHTEGSMTDLRNCHVFEVVAKGEGVSDEIKVGDHCRPIAVALDPVDPKWQTRYARVKEIHIPMTWDVGELNAVAKNVSERKELARKRALGLED